MSDASTTADSTSFDVLVLGSGPGGHAAAARAADLGMKTMLVGDGRGGAIGVDAGSVYSRTLLSFAEIAHVISQREQFGISGDAYVDFSHAVASARSVAASSAADLRRRTIGRGVTHVEGFGRLTSQRSVEVRTRGGLRSYAFHNLVIATGADALQLPYEAPAGSALTFAEVLGGTSCPPSAVIAGGGPTGVETAFLLKAFGSAVTLLEQRDRLLPTEDPDVSSELLRQYRRLGIDVRTSASVVAIDGRESGVAVRVQTAGSEVEVIDANKIVSAIGVTPRISEIGLEKAGVKRHLAGGIDVDPCGRTTVDHIFAVGDCTGRPMHASTAEAQGRLAAETIATKSAGHTDARFQHSLPRAVYSRPQVAAIGLTAAQARDAGIDVVESTFPLTANGKARGMGDHGGFVKVLANRSTELLIGAHLIGSSVSELLPAIAVASMWDLTTEELARNVFAHPTYGEAIRGASEGITGAAIDL